MGVDQNVFGHKKRKLKTDYDGELLDLINTLKEKWDYAQKPKMPSQMLTMRFELKPH
ncbi:hypothetical protein NBRC111893_789 [Lentilactobacillus kosonis]|uniref:Uncharacterized protein n=1 Tax=Lentilactobacillus kosonis TaxID=2810561 RepID=A0A401FJW5_9LACO|nr:hypothetical protein NBRC111893_789 [Lentilactobacillus kosonis]